ncbi:hypothetical protein PR048_016225 [Dryococelus australis]|uniref:Uncharacterized protein n=1 Tax=Dryococelus australis TaxID=614101 RepID=A0ABQ9HJ49_9NEOP|nr:hypothetical protein PR048_016225 [Dryococelus australis]
MARLRSNYVALTDVVPHSRHLSEFGKRVMPSDSLSQRVFAPLNRLYVKDGFTTTRQSGKTAPTQTKIFHQPIRSKIFVSWNRARRCRWSAGFLGDLPFPPALHSGAAPYSPRFSLIGSQYFDVKSRPNLFTHSFSSSARKYTKFVIDLPVG